MLSNKLLLKLNILFFKKGDILDLSNMKTNYDNI